MHDDQNAVAFHALLQESGVKVMVEESLLGLLEDSSVAEVLVAADVDSKRWWRGQMEARLLLTSCAKDVS
jgi:hypothetical protein